MPWKSFLQPTKIRILNSGGIPCRWYRSSPVHPCSKRWNLGTAPLCLSVHATLLHEVQPHQLRSLGNCVSERNAPASTRIEEEFDAENFVIKRTPHLFNQVDPDQSQEWLNVVGKNGGGIIGITKTPSALSRWALSYNLRSHLALETRAVFAVGSDDDLVHNETTKSRMKQDTKDEDSLVTTLESFTLFSSDLPHTLQNIANKDLVTEAIEADLLAAETKGQDQLNSFVEERLMAFPKNSF